MGDVIKQTGRQACTKLCTRQASILMLAATGRYAETDYGWQILLEGLIIAALLVIPQ